MRGRWTTALACLVPCIGVGGASEFTNPMTHDVVNDAAWCRTAELWRAAAPPDDPPEEGGCPLQGICDDADVRDLFLAGPATLFTTIRLNLVVFRETDGSNPAATVEEIEHQIAQLQSHFAPYRIRFFVQWSYVLDSTYRDIDNDLLLVKDMKMAYAVAPEQWCNVFVTDFAYSFAVLPWDPNALTALGGVVVDEDRFRMEHMVLTHEVGHALGLWHTHHGVTEVETCGPCYERADGLDGDQTGDFCSDTPPTPPNFGQCVDAAGEDECSGAPWGDTLPEDFMSFGTIDGTSCWSVFTRQQAARMRCWTIDALDGWQPCGNGLDCNGNGVPDDCDIVEGTSLDDDGDGFPDECDVCPGDLDGDGVVTVNDILLLLIQWGACQPPCGGACFGDLDDDCDVAVSDLLIILAGCG